MVRRPPITTRTDTRFHFTTLFCSVLDDDVLQRLCGAFRVFEDALAYLVIDTAAGIAPIVTGFVERADLAVIVINDEPASFIDGYGLLKALAARGRCRRALILTNMTTSEASGRHLDRKSVV